MGSYSMLIRRLNLKKKVVLILHVIVMCTKILGLQAIAVPYRSLCLQWKNGGGT